MLFCSGGIHLFGYVKNPRPEDMDFYFELKTNQNDQTIFGIQEGLQYY